MFSKRGKAALSSIIKHRPLLAFDFDGTLAAIKKDPSLVKVEAGVLELLDLLSRKYSCVIITGRSRRDTRRYLPNLRLDIIGNHGLEKPGSPPPPRFLRRWEEDLLKALAGFHEVEIENKRYSLSVHHRRARDHRKAKEKILRAVRGLKPAPRIIPGKDVFNLLPPDGDNKGTALKKQMRKLALPWAVYVGDDCTDEDVFRMGRRRIMGVRVGLSLQTKASYFLRSQKEINRLLFTLIQG